MENRVTVCLFVSLSSSVPAERIAMIQKAEDIVDELHVLESQGLRRDKNSFLEQTKVRGLLSLSKGGDSVKFPQGDKKAFSFPLRKGQTNIIPGQVDSSRALACFHFCFQWRVQQSTWKTLTEAESIHRIKAAL